MAKKENPNIYFRKEWWLYLKWKQPLLRDEVLSRFFNHCFGMETVNIEAISINPSEAEQLLIPMITQYEQDKEAYETKCSQLRENASKSHSRTNLLPNNDKQEQMVANGSNDVSLVPYKRKEKERKEKENNSSLPSLPSPNPSSVEKSEEEEEREELLFSLTFYFLTEGVLNPYTTAQKAIAHNESMNWQVRTEKGIIYDHSHDKLAFLRGWRCERNCYNLNDATIFADFCRETNFSDLSVINDYRGISYQGNLTFLFQHAKHKQAFHSVFMHDKASLNRAFAFIAERFPESKGFSCDIYKKD